MKLTKIDSQANTVDLVTYQNLSQAYEAEFSRLTGKRPNSQGLYPITQLDNLHQGFLFQDKTMLPLGFVVIDLGRAAFDIAEFYIIPAARRGGLGRYFASAAFDLFRGDWQVRQIAGADQAHAFWCSVIATYTKGHFLQAFEVDPDWGQVRVQRFTNR